MDARGSEYAARCAGTGLWAYREQILLYLLNRARLRYVSGHFPCTDSVEPFRSGSFVTMLRHPVDRWFSLYFYDRARGASLMPRHACIDEYIESDRGRETAELYLRTFGSSGFIGTGESESCSTERARQRLQSFRLVGNLDNIQGFESRFRQAFGTSIRVGRRNSNPVSDYRSDSEVTPGVRARVEKLCEQYIEIYEYAARYLDC